MEDESIYAIVRKQEMNFISGTTKFSKYVQFSMFETLARIDAYLNSQHISGKLDSQMREKPFFNIVRAAVNVWYRATNIARKDIRIAAAVQSDYTAAFLATMHLNAWMKKADFGTFLAEWGRTLAEYGSAVVKFIEKDGVLHVIRVPWQRIICDAVNFDAAVKIEKLYMTPAQLRQKKEYNQDIIEKLITSTLTARKTIDKEQMDLLNDYIELYEVHGNLPLSMIPGKEDKGTNEKNDKIYAQQMHVISYVAQEDGEYEDFGLYDGLEDQDPYMITHLIKETGRSLSVGAVENLFDAQWMQNHSVKQARDILDFVSKLMYQTADPQFAGRNVLDGVEVGDIMVYDPTKGPISGITHGDFSSVLSQIASFGAQWRMAAQDLTSTPDAVKGNTLPSGTPYSLGAYLGAQANSLFEVMTENKGIALEKMLRKFIIPYIKTTLDTTEEVAATLDASDIAQLDAMFLPKAAVKAENQRIINEILAGHIPQPPNVPQAMQGIQQAQQQQGNKRFFTPDEDGKITWSEVFKDFEWKAEVLITNESVDKKAALETLNTVMSTVAGNPLILNNPTIGMIFNKILSLVGSVSPLELTGAQGFPVLPKMTLRENIDFKDLPEEAKAQLLAKIGIQYTPPQQAQTPPAQLPPPVQVPPKPA